uniref:Calneuron 1 n=2 Tax=Phasianus colchicus TaxID=9054 RepID=A0A669PCP7_PHACC
MWALEGGCVWPQAFCCPPLGSSISFLPLLAAMIARSRRALLAVSPVNKGKAHLSHSVGEGHIIKNVEGCWKRQAAPHFISCSQELLRFFFEQAIGGIFWQVKFVVLCATVQRVWVLHCHGHLACCYGTTGVWQCRSADSVSHGVMSLVVFICNNRSLKLLFSEIREAFRVLDRDGNGFISKQELGMAMRSLGYMPSEVELAIIMQRLDMDGDGQVDFDEFMTILGPKLVSSEGRDGFLGNTIDSIFWQFDMQRITLEELKHILYHAFRDHLTMKDIENIIINEEESLNENSGNCQTEFEVHAQKQNRQTCVRKSLICAFAMAFIISVMLIAANQILRSGME